MVNYYLTFDIGTLNLAYCLACIEKSYEDIKILDWNLLNISSTIKCEKCKKNAIYKNISNNGLCKTHYTKLDKDDKKLYKKIETKNELYKQSDNLIPKLETLYNTLLKAYDISEGKLLYCENIQIFIENQPALKNPTMKTISVIIFTFFYSKMINNNKIISDVKFISATTKTKPTFLKKFIGIEIIDKFNQEMLDNKKNLKNKNVIDSKNKQLRKDLVEYTVNEIGKKINKKKYYNSYYFNYYNVNKKKDDLADAFIYVICAFYD